VGIQINTSTEVNNRLWKLIENHKRIEKYKKEKLADIFRLIGIILHDLERSRI